MNIADYFAATTFLIGMLCFGAIIPIALRAETLFLRVAVMGVLVLEGSRNVLSGYLRTASPESFGAGTQAAVFSILNTLLFVGMVLFIVATLRLDRPASSGEVREKLEGIDEKVTEVRDAVVESGDENIADDIYPGVSDEEDERNPGRYGP